MVNGLQKTGYLTILQTILAHLLFSGWRLYSWSRASSIMRQWKINCNAPPESTNCSALMPVASLSAALLSTLSPHTFVSPLYQCTRPSAPTTKRGCAKIDKAPITCSYMMCARMRPNNCFSFHNLSKRIFCSPANLHVNLY